VRLGRWWERLTPREGWTTLLLVYFLFLSVIWSVERAHWVPATPDLLWLVFGSTIAGLLLAKVPLPAFLLQPVGLGLGFVVASWRSAALVPAADWGQRIDLFEARLRGWLEVLRDGGISGDLLPFAFLLALATWALGFWGSWYVFRRGNPWPAVLLGGVALLTNLTYLPPRFYPHFAVFLVLAMLVIAQVNLVHRREQWKREKVQTPEFLSVLALNDAFWFLLALLLVAWFVPLWKPTPGFMKEGWEQFRRPWVALEDEFVRAFAGLPAQRSFPLHTFGDALPFRGSISLGDQVIFQVSSDFPGYWRGRSYDIYTSKGWLASNRITRPLRDSVPQPLEPPPGMVEVRHRIATNVSSPIIFAPGIPVDGSGPLVAEVPKPQVHAISLSDSSGDDALPSDLRLVAEQVRQQLQEARERAVQGQPTALLPEGFLLEKIVSREGLPQELHVSRAQEVGDIVALKPGSGRPEAYSIVTWMPITTEEELRQVGEDYPEWVKERYLQLPADLPPMIRTLSLELTRDASTPYDKVAAIESYLRGFTYSQDISPPPFDADGVAYFLSQKKGYSDYFGSALAVMLRSIGIPARLVVGYAVGDKDPKTGLWVVRDKDSHSWTEVYFPGYGWTSFEPTPSRQRIHRGPPPAPPEVTEEFEDILDLPFFLEDEFLFGGAIGGSAAQQESPSQWQWGRPLAMALSALLAMVLLAVVLSRKVLWGQTPVVQAYGGISRWAAMAGLGRRPSQTPGEFASALARAVPGLDWEFRTVAEGYAQSRYGKRLLSQDEEQRVRHAWRRARLALLRYAVVSRLPRRRKQRRR
jgi:hypothetical protein